MSKTSEYFADYAEELNQAGIDYTLATTYAVYYDFNRSDEIYGGDELVSYPTLEQATEAFIEAYRRLKRKVEDAIAERSLSWKKDVNAFGSVGLCINLDVIFHPANILTDVDLSFSGKNPDGSLWFDTDFTDLDQSFSSLCNIAIHDYPDMDPYMDIDWVCGEIEIPAE